MRDRQQAIRRRIARQAVSRVRQQQSDEARAHAAAARHAPYGDSHLWRWERGDNDDLDDDDNDDPWDDGPDPEDCVCDGFCVTGMCDQNPNSYLA
jgi:hypothetical protein